MKAIALGLLISTLLFATYSFLATVYILKVTDENEEYLEIMCSTEHWISKANPIDPVIAKLQVISWFDDLCEDYKPPITNIPGDQLPSF